MSVKRTETSTGIHIHTPPEHPTGEGIEQALLKTGDGINARRKWFFDWLADGADKAKAAASDPSMSKQDRKDAAGVHVDLLAINGRIREGNAKEAAYEAFLLGELYIRINARWLEKYVKRGRKELADSQKGFTETHGTESERELRYKGFQTHVDREVTRGYTYMKACSITAEKTGWAAETIRRHTNDPTK